MIPKKQSKLSGWGGTKKEKCLVYRPEYEYDLKRITITESALIARGGGLSYGDAAISNAVVDVSKIDYFKNFDITRGKITIDAGITLSQILSVIVPKGWCLPVMPGTKFATIGGAVACNVHGKNQYNKGEIGEHIEALKIRLSDGTLKECSLHKNQTLFNATIGGMGMTGIIQEVTIKLFPIKTASIKTTKYKVKSLEEMLYLFEDNKDRAEYMVGWIDHFQKKPGAGYFETAEHETNTNKGLALSKFCQKKATINIPFNFPSWALNKYTMKIYNSWIFKKYSKKPKTTLSSFDNFFHPLDGIGNWNRLYGKGGFLQYQCIIPENKKTLEHIQKLLRTIKANKCFSFLAVIKYHKESTIGDMKFSLKGYSLALDFPNNKKVVSLFKKLDKQVILCGGKVYLAKDARLDYKTLNQMYKKQITQWKKNIKLCDNMSKFQSAMSRRLKFK